MTKRVLSYIIIVLVLNMALWSCVKDVDFDQVDEFEISPVVESSFIFLDESAGRFFSNGLEVSNISDFINTDVFDDLFLDNKLVRADMVFETINSINKGFQLKLDFLNDAGQLQHSFVVPVSASPSNNEVLEGYTEIFEGNSLTALKATTKIEFTLSLVNGPVINQNTPGSISLKSKTVFYFNIKDIL